MANYNHIVSVNKIGFLTFTPEIDKITFNTFYTKFYADLEIAENLFALSNLKTKICWLNSLLKNIALTNCLNFFSAFIIRPEHFMKPFD